MSEFVQRHMESMISEIREMQRTKLYSPEEIKLILDKRREFELKVNGITKKLEDFKAYIMYEKVLLRQLKLRRDKSLIGERKSAIEFKILGRIKNLYEIAVQRFSNDFNLKLEYFKFCKQSNYIKAASTTCQSMLKNFGSKPEVWLVAAKWYAQDLNDLSTAFKILHNGLTRLKDSQVLYTEAISLELSVVKEENEVSEEESKKREKVCEKIKTYVNLICENIKDSSYLVQILTLLETYSFTMPVQNFIIEKLLENYSNMECVWDALAKRELRGLHYNNDKPSESKVFLCTAKYKEGLDKVSPSEKTILLSKYLDCMTSVIPSRPEDKQFAESIKKDLKKVLEKTDNERYLTKECYIIWLDLVSDAEAHDILKKATTSIPQSIELWELRLKFATMMGKNAEVDKIFEEGVAALKEQALSLWLIYLRYYSLLARNDVIDDIYRKGIKQPQAVSETLKPRYIEWLALEKGMSDARKMYNILSIELPYCKDLHITMDKLERTEYTYDFDLWGRVHELACQQFGKKDVDVWMNYIMFYLHFNKTETVNDNVQRIYREAENTLDPLLQSEFKEKYLHAIAE